MPEYLNPHPHDLYLSGPDGKTVHIRKGHRAQLSSFFDRYVNKSAGHLIKVSNNLTAPPLTLGKHMVRPNHASVRPKPPNKKVIMRRVVKRSTPIVGRSTHGAAADISYSEIITKHSFPISNNIGVGILTYNRPGSLQRLVDSITKYTNLNNTTLFISDDGSTNTEQLNYLSQLEKRGDIVVLKNQGQLGIAGNSNRILHCLSRFPYKILLNDDVEILHKGWEHFYFQVMHHIDFHHFCYRQLGVYGAKKGVPTTVKATLLDVVNEKPHGAVMAFDEVAFAKIGYFDEQFGQYGSEHVDWSSRISNSGIQQPGFYDVSGSDKYFLVHSEPSAVMGRIEKFKHAQAIFDAIGKRSSYVTSSSMTLVPRISCVIPFRDIGRKDSILTVLRNIRAQQYPDIEIVMSEEDVSCKLSGDECAPAIHIFTTGAPGPAFNKSKAWNTGVAACTCDLLVLHDADTLAPNSYFKLVADTLIEAESCHLCGKIYYLDEAMTQSVNSTGVMDESRCESVVNYFEGGTIACRRKTYWKIGGFVEEYVGYGCEDCDFYYRLSRASVWKEDRQLSLVHLYHGRVDGWALYHVKNKALEKKLSELMVSDRISHQRQLLTNSKWARFLE
jgi:GT2 family glycosyltransferase